VAVVLVLRRQINEHRRVVIVDFGIEVRAFNVDEAQLRTLWLRWIKGGAVLAYGRDGKAEDRPQSLKARGRAKYEAPERSWHFICLATSRDR
jgi:hypothetical protein